MLMKYAVNQEWRFQYYKTAFLIGFLQASISIFVEICNLGIIFVNSSEVIDVIADFLVILVISEFDDYFYTISGQQIYKDMITEDKYAELLKIETTSSKSARARIPEHKIMEVELKDDQFFRNKKRPEYIFI